MAFLVDPYLKYLHLENASFFLIDHEDAIIAIVYKIEHEGQEFILKISPRRNDYLRELFFLKTLKDQIPIPHVLQIVPPESGLDGAILMQCLKGNVLQIEDLTDELAYEIGAVLARIHSNRMDGWGDLIVSHQLSHDPQIHFTFKFEESLSECKDHLPKNLIDQSRSFYESHVHLLKGTDGTCLIHRDFRPGNVMVDEGRLQGVIDWSSGRAGFAEEDFCHLEYGSWGTNPHIKSSFLQGYESIRPVPPYQTLMPFLLLNRAIAIIGYLVKTETWQSKNAKLYQSNRSFLEKFFKV